MVQWTCLWILVLIEVIDCHTYMYGHALYLHGLFKVILLNLASFNSQKDGWKLKIPVHVSLAKYSKRQRISLFTISPLHVNGDDLVEEEILCALWEQGNSKRSWYYCNNHCDLLVAVPCCTLCWQCWTQHKKNFVKDWFILPLVKIQFKGEEGKKALCRTGIM